MNKRSAHLAVALALCLGAVAPPAASACDVAYIAGQPSSKVQFPGGRDSRKMKHYVVLSSTDTCSGILVGWSSCLDDKHLVIRPSSNARFMAGDFGEAKGYIISCPSACVQRLAARSEIVGHLTGSKEISGYIVKGGSQAIRGFLLGCPSSQLRGFLADSPTSSVTNHVVKSGTNNTYHILSRSSYVTRFIAGRTARATTSFVGSGPSRVFTHCLVRPRTNTRKFVVSMPSSACPGFLGGASSRSCPEYVADTQCED
ncbi:MAG: hypothetical protein GXP25_20105 [Planctomycetes bacterium]|nr:hypothetical protein [Planctomycetota bacterium]